MELKGTYIIDNYIDLKKTARQGGVLYFIWVLTAFYSLMYVSSRTIVPGDAAATAEKMLANELLFRSGIINNILSSVIWIFIAWTLYKLFKHVNDSQAKLLVWLVIIQVTFLFFSEAFNMASLMAFKGEILKNYDLVQRQDIGLLFLKINGYGTAVLETFWGLWLFPFGYLVYKSGFIPKILGILLILNGIAYIIHSFTTILFPEYQDIVRQVSIPFWTLGEISITLWLLIKGIRKPQTISSN
jgi:hypothetical protein